MFYVNSVAGNAAARGPMLAALLCVPAVRTRLSELGLDEMSGPVTRFFEAYGSFMAGPLCNIGRVRQAFADLGLTGPDDIALAWRLMTALMPRCLRQHQCTSDEEWEAWAQRSMELRRVLLRSDEALGLAGLDQLVQDIGQWLETADLGGFEGVVAFRYLSRRLGPDQQYLLDELSRLYPASLREQCLVTTTARRLVPA